MTSKYQHVRLDSIEINLANIDVANRWIRKGRGRRHKQHDAGGVTAQDEGRSFGTRRKAGQTKHWNLSTVTGAVDVEVGRLACRISQVNAGMVAAQVKPSGQVIKQVFTRIFMKGSPPFETPGLGTPCSACH